jgi:DNA polymerase (family 10)
MENPHVDALFHLTGRKIKARPPIELDIDAIIKAAKRTGTALEINASPDRLDIRDEYIRKAVAAGVMLTIDSDAHSPSHFGFLEYGIAQARRGWAGKKNILNTRSVEEVLKWLQTPKEKR